MKFKLSLERLFLRQTRLSKWNNSPTVYWTGKKNGDRHLYVKKFFENNNNNNNL